MSAPIVRYGLLLVVSVLLLACREQRVEPGGFQRETQPIAGDARSFRMGFSSIPGELSDEAYLKTYDISANYGEVLLIQRPPAWADFLPGRSVSAELRAQTLAERRAAEARGLDLVYVLDVFDVADRGNLQALPAGYGGRTLEDEELSQALRADALFVARSVKPAYLIVGHEVNVTFEHDPIAYEMFVKIYSEIFDALRLEGTETEVLTTFQYEELLGVVPWLPPHAPRWELFDDFAGRLDALGITTYPSFAYPIARRIDPLYYEQIREHTTLPLAFVAAGYSSGDGRRGINGSTPAEQRRFLQRLLEDADRLASPLVIWLLSRDPSYATGPPEDLIASLGLLDVSGAPKEAWPAWLEAAARPYQPPQAGD